MKKKYQIFCATLGLSLIATTSFAHSFGANNLNDQSNYTLTNLAVPAMKATTRTGSVNLQAQLKNSNGDKNTICNYKIEFSRPSGADILTPYNLRVTGESENSYNCQTLNVASIANSNQTTITYPAGNQLLTSFSFSEPSDNKLARITYKPQAGNRVITLQQLSIDTFALQSNQAADINSVRCSVNAKKQTHSNKPTTLMCGYTKYDWAGFHKVLKHKSLPTRFEAVYQGRTSESRHFCEYQIIDNTTDYKVIGNNSSLCQQKITHSDHNTYNIPYNLSENSALQLSEIHPTDNTDEVIFNPFFLVDNAPYLSDLKATVQFDNTHNKIKIMGKDLLQAGCHDKSGDNIIGLGKFLKCNQNVQSNYTLTNLAVPKIDKTSKKGTVVLTAALKNKEVPTPCNYDIVFSENNQKNSAPYTISVKKESNNPQICAQTLNVKTGSNPTQTTITYPADKGLYYFTFGNEDDQIAGIEFKNTPTSKAITLQQLSKDTFALQSSKVKDVTTAYCSIYSSTGEKQISTLTPGTLKCGQQNS